jgi:hypothetical protein
METKELILSKTTLLTYSILEITETQLFIQSGGNSSIGTNFHRKKEIKSWSDFEHHSPYSNTMLWLLECKKEGGIEHFNEIFNILNERLGNFEEWKHREGTHTETVFNEVHKLNKSEPLIVKP